MAENTESHETCSTLSTNAPDVCISFPGSAHVASGQEIGPWSLLAATMARAACFYGFQGGLVCGMEYSRPIFWSQADQ